MPRRPTTAAPRPKGGGRGVRPLHEQVYEGLRASVVRGELGPGERVPSSRAAAERLGVARATVTLAYERLAAEGYLEGRPGSGTFVAPSLPDDAFAAPRAARLPASPARAAAPRPPRAAAAPLPPRGGPRAFQMNVPALDEFPLATWSRLGAEAWREADRSWLGYQPPGGHAPLREAVAKHLREVSGLACGAEQVVVTAGSQQALGLVARVLLGPGDAVWVEEPGYYAARRAFADAGAAICPVPVDAEGLSVDAGRAASPAARLAYVTPSNQCPLAVRLSAERRLALLAWAREAGAWVVEDEFDSAFRYRGRPLASLHALDGGERVIYVGSFSLSVFPALRIGFAVVPPALAGPLAAARAMADWHSPVAAQAQLAAFVGRGHLARHVRRMRVLYAERQAAVLDEAPRALGGMLELAARDAGVHLVGWLGEGIDEARAVAEAARRGVEVRPLSMYALAPPARGALLLGYASASPGALRAGVRRLAAALDAARKGAGA